MEPDWSDERDLIVLAQAGNHQARLRLYTRYEVRIHALARRYRCPGLEDSDMEQTGLLALLDALPAFDAARGASLWAYVEPHVRGAMTLASSKWQGLSDHERSVYAKVRRMRDRLWNENGQAPDVAQLAQACGESAKTVTRLMVLWSGGQRSLEDEFIPAEARLLSAHPPGPDEALLAAEAAEEGGRAIRAALGADEAPSFWVLTILFEAGGYNYGWSEIAAMLDSGSPAPRPAWERTVDAEFGHFTDVPGTWAEAVGAFTALKRPLTAAMLRQRYSRAVQRIQRRQERR